MTFASFRIHNAGAAKQKMLSLQPKTCELQYKRSSLLATQLSEKARAFLQERRFAVLGTLNADGSPQLTTMWYLLEGDTIVMNTMIGRIKDRNLRRDPRISLCVPDGYNYVTIAGTAELIDDSEIAQHD